ncbi:hypothetical protein FHS78_000395 [Parvibaculum indicum]|uniref:hypothetical protein n=1 Tax=Parvibaculum indicum TaxID=562969 RepID=UPI00141D8D72|nr:hypothetical protein [Parvibaculum indicum]NIJ40140.1 hypothetical protein [Parvibaculum indicum]
METGEKIIERARTGKAIDRQIAASERDKAFIPLGLDGNRPDCPVSIFERS